MFWINLTPVNMLMSFHVPEFSRIADVPIASQEGFCSMKLVGWFVAPNANIYTCRWQSKIIFLQRQDNQPKY
jgi:hypothetical protein